MLRRHLARLGLPGLGLLALSGCADPQGAYVQPSYGQPRGGRSCDTSFTVENRSSGTVEELYYSHSSMRGWGNDRLGRNVLPPGRSVSYRAANAGAHDFRVVWANGRSAELRGIDVCAASTITVTNSGLRAS